MRGSSRPVCRSSARRGLEPHAAVVLRDAALVALPVAARRPRIAGDCRRRVAPARCRAWRSALRGRAALVAASPYYYARDRARRARRHVRLRRVAVGRCRADPRRRRRLGAWRPGARVGRRGHDHHAPAHLHRVRSLRPLQGRAGRHPHDEGVVLDARRRPRHGQGRRGARRPARRLTVRALMGDRVEDGALDLVRRAVLDRLGARAPGRVARRDGHPPRAPHGRARARLGRGRVPGCLDRAAKCERPRDGACDLQLPRAARPARRRRSRLPRRAPRPRPSRSSRRRQLHDLDEEARRAVLRAARPARAGARRRLAREIRPSSSCSAPTSTRSISTTPSAPRRDHHQTRSGRADRWISSPSTICARRRSASAASRCTRRSCPRAASTASSGRPSRSSAAARSSSAARTTSSRRSPRASARAGSSRPRPGTTRRPSRSPARSSARPSPS